ncbi:MAG: carboxypeptidase regulatory-like domain-containing protein, partial [Eggerthellaceae bacterium]|nr:carboxypeptidase regulatory-like domain-containing protein [Eggerthellaceae bacterium]MCI8341591.1 carboxypeptidase regulatory-like domain-containing protein [Eggerthellaceae bacterium]
AGIVVDLEADEVVIGAKVTAENLGTGEVLVTQTDEFGDFWFHQVGAAEWRVYVEAQGYMTRAVEASTKDEDRNMGPIEVFAA